NLRSLYANVSVKRWPTSVGVAPVQQSMRVSVTSAGACAIAGSATRTLAHTPTANRIVALSMVSSSGSFSQIFSRPAVSSGHRNRARRRRAPDASPRGTVAQGAHAASAARPGKSVLMRIVRGPQDLVRPDVVRQHRDAAFDGLERDPAIALEQF